jgi:two-component sensor histidine kinase
MPAGQTASTIVRGNRAGGGKTPRVGRLVAQVISGQIIAGRDQTLFAVVRELESETDDTKRRALVLIASDYLRKLEKSLKDAENLRNLAVKELGHRLKNKVATIQSIIAYQLRHNEMARDTILRRLSALSSADMLIEAAQGQGASVKDIINIELSPYEISRATVEGPQIFLPPKLALVLGL